MNKICKSCRHNCNLNRKFPCFKCSNNEINNSKLNCEYTTTFGTFNLKLENNFELK